MNQRSMDPLLVSVPRVHWLVAAQSIATVTTANIIFTSAPTDRVGVGAAGVTLTVPAGMGGWWAWSVHILATGAGPHTVKLAWNGTAYDIASTPAAGCMGETILGMAAADALVVQVTNGSAGTLSFAVSLLGVRLSPL